MDIIFTVSPDYLNIFEKQTEPYSFSIQGYRDIKLAISRLHMTNSKNILGFTYIADDIPNPKLLLKLVKYIDLTITKETVFVLVVRNQETLKKFVDIYKGSKVKILTTPKFEVLNDTIIRNCIIGPILKTRYKPYLDDEEKVTIPTIKSNDWLRYNRIVEPRLLDIISPVKVLSNIQETVKFDAVLLNIPNKDSYYFRKRLAYIYAHFGREYDISMNTKSIDETMLRVIDKLISNKIKENMTNR